LRVKKLTRPSFRSLAAADDQARADELANLCRRRDGNAG
jgi:hypothetical protein